MGFYRQRSGEVSMVFLECFYTPFSLSLTSGGQILFRTSIPPISYFSTRYRALHFVKGI
jgi:hypothetical protein